MKLSMQLNGEEDVKTGLCSTAMRLEGLVALETPRWTKHLNTEGTEGQNTRLIC